MMSSSGRRGHLPDGQEGRGRAVNFVLVEAPGQTVRVADVTDDEIAAAVSAVQP